MHETSKSERKRRALALHAVGEALTRLSAAQRGRLPLSPDLLAALAEFDHIRSRPARKRQLQYVARLIRETDSDAIVAGVNSLKREAEAHSTAHHALERWRDALLGDPEALNDYVAAYPRTDQQALAELIRTARQHPDERARKAAARAMFRQLRADKTASGTTGAAPG